MSDALPGYRFYLEIAGVYQAVFTEIGSFNIENTPMEVVEGGLNGHVHRLPGRTTVGTLTLKRGMTRTNELFRWCVLTMWGLVIKQNVSLVLYDLQGREMVRWNFIKAWPMRWTSPQLTADGQTMAIETLELAHEGLWWL